MLKQDWVCPQYSHWELQYPYKSPSKNIDHLSDFQGVFKVAVEFELFSSTKLVLALWFTVVSVRFLPRLVETSFKWTVRSGSCK